jgi:hypothetical protein
MVVDILFWEVFLIFPRPPACQIQPPVNHRQLHALDVDLIVITALDLPVGIQQLR